MASADGYFYMFDVNTQEGGVCKLLIQSSLYTLNTNIFNSGVQAPAQLEQNNGKDPNTSQNQQQYPLDNEQHFHAQVQPSTQFMSHNNQTDYQENNE
jgi:hypothetical protein